MSLLWGVVVTDMNGIRYSHPKPGNIGSHFIGDDIFPALEGKENVSINHGVLAEALRVFTPVYNEQHKQIGVVAIGDVFAVGLRQSVFDGRIIGQGSRHRQRGIFLRLAKWMNRSARAAGACCGRCYLAPCSVHSAPGCWCAC